MAFAQANLALNKTAFSSSNEENSLAANFAFDGNVKTRWSSAFSDNQWIAVDLGANYYLSEIRLHWQNSYGREYLIQTSFDGEEWTTVHTQNDGQGGIENFSINGEGRYVRMFGLKRFTRYGFSLFAFEVYGHQPDINRALLVPVTTSSIENDTLNGSFAVDGNSKSRWASVFADNQWIVLDLGESHRIKRLKLHWQNSYAREYEIQFSQDGVEWTSVFHETDSDGGLDDLMLRGGGRFLRILCIKRFTRYGFSLFEIEAFGYPADSAILEQENRAATESSDPGSSAPEDPAIEVPAAPIAYDGFEDRIELSWSSGISPDDTAFYKLYRDGVVIADIEAGQVKYTDFQVTPDQLYNYQLFGCNLAGACSPLGNVLSAGIDSLQQLTLYWDLPVERENGDFLASTEVGGYEIRIKNLDGETVRSLLITDALANRINLGQNSAAFLFDIATFDIHGLYSVFVAIEP